MFNLQLEFDITADEFGIYDGRTIAQSLVTEAMRLTLPYVKGDAGAAGRIMRALVLGAADTLHKEFNAAGTQNWGLHCDDDVVGGDPVEAMKKHAEATKAITEALLERADIGFERDDN